MAVLVALWQSSLLICIRITVVTCKYAGLSHLLHPIKSRCADVDGQPLVHIHTRTWQNLKKDKVQKSGYTPLLSFLAFEFFSTSSWSVCSSRFKSEWKSQFTDPGGIWSSDLNHPQALFWKNYSNFFLSLVDFVFMGFFSDWLILLGNRNWLDDYTCKAYMAACSFIRKHSFFVCQPWGYIPSD